MEHLGLRRGEVLVAAYDPAWPQLFVQEKQRLLSALAPYVTKIEHVGSTSVPGLAAKPLIDMIAAVRLLDDYKKLIAPLRSLDYEFMPKRVFEDRVFLPKGPRSNRTHHLSIVVYGGKQWQETLLFRDSLISHETIRKDYEKLKRDLAKKFPQDRAAYTKAKDDFIKATLAHCILTR
jgi:GrpB-like predicted nucleotidyltransferase (UPF0157 family)